jgi:ribosomal protein L32E
MGWAPVAHAVILVTQEAEIRRIAVQSQMAQIVHETLSRKKKKITKKGGGVAQGIGPEFRPQYHTHIHAHKMQVG